MSPETVPISVAEKETTPVSLFERYGDEVVTFKGVTGPISALIELCPVPKDQMDPQKVEEWTANILVESGVDVPQELMPEVADEAKENLN